MKTCTKCNLTKEDSNFFIRDKAAGRLHAQCKDCYKQQRSQNYANHYQKYRESYLARAKLRREKLRLEFRKNMLNYMSGKSCIDCGENDVQVLELDHRDPDEKTFTISQAVKLGYSWEEVEGELIKCVVRCANCHKRRTAQQYGWYKSKQNNGGAYRN